MTKEQIQTVSNFLCRTGMTLSEWYELASIAKKLHKINVLRCNGRLEYDPKLKQRVSVWTETDDKRASGQVDQLEQDAHKISKRYSFSAVYQGDPRGYSLKLQDFSLREELIPVPYWFSSSDKGW